VGSDMCIRDRINAQLEQRNYEGLLK
jgi:hypothetical protein